MAFAIDFELHCLCCKIQTPPPPKKKKKKKQKHFFRGGRRTLELTSCFMKTCLWEWVRGRELTLKAVLYNIFNGNLFHSLNPSRPGDLKEAFNVCELHDETKVSVKLCNCEMKHDHLNFFSSLYCLITLGFHSRIC